MAQIRASAECTRVTDVRDLRGLLWSSIDNDTSRDLDQIEVAERVDGGIRVRVGVADVSASVLKDTPIDEHAADQTQTVYTAVRNFSMLPTELSTDMTSLNEDEDRAAHVVEFVVDAEGMVGQTSIYQGGGEEQGAAGLQQGWALAGGDGWAGCEGGGFGGVAGAVAAAG